MKAIKLTGLRSMQIMTVPDPVLQDDHDVLIRMTTVGVCGSDIHYYRTGCIGKQVVKYPFTVGHEGAGIVEKTGKAVTRVRPGDRVAIDPAMSCRKCDQCLSGRPHTCRKLRFLGCPGQAEGCLSEFIVMPETNCFPLKKNVSLEQAAISEPLSIGLYAVKLSKLQKGAAIGILGSGPIGISVLLTAKAYGAGKVYMTDKIDERLALAAAMGATWTGNPLMNDVVDAMVDVEPLRLDAVFECCGQQEAMDQAIELLKPGGKLMIVGIPEAPRVSFPVDDMRHREIRIQNVRRQCDCVEESLDLIGRGMVNADPMVTHRFPLSHTAEAFEMVGDYRDGVMKAMIEVSEE